MTEKELRDCCELAQELQEMLDRTDRICEMARRGKLKSCVIDGYGNPLSDGTGEGAAILSDLDMGCGYAEKLRNFIKSKASVEMAIDTLESPRYRRVMKMRYIDGMSWDSICREMHYSRDGIMKIHRKAMHIILDAKVSTPFYMKM